MYEWRSDLYYVKYAAYILQIYSNDLCVVHKFVYLNARLLEMFQWNANSWELYSKVEKIQNETGSSTYD